VPIGVTGKEEKGGGRGEFDMEASKKKDLGLPERPEKSEEPKKTPATVNGGEHWRKKKKGTLTQREKLRRRARTAGSKAKAIAKVTPGRKTEGKRKF